MALLTMFSFQLNPESNNLAAMIKPVVTTTPDTKTSKRPIDQPKRYVARPIDGASSMVLMPWLWGDAVVWSNFGSIGWSALPECSEDIV